ncbi:MAG TPA: argininosuccinate synthase [Actinomycetota bacterium]
MTDICVLAYSGGLDTSIAIKWIKDNYGYDVIALAVDVGQPIDPEAVIAKGKASGAIDTLVVDARDEFARDYVLPALKANALYMGKYPLVSALSRPLIARHLVRVARERGAAAIAHGCTGKGNDQVRFEVSTTALAPDLRSIAPVRDSAMTREAAIAYAEQHNIPIPVTRSSPYSIDENLWGRTIECGAIEDPWAAPPADAWATTSNPVDSPDEPEALTIAFEAGKPVALDGDAMALPDLILAAGQRAARHGIGRIDMMEDRLVGIKSRELYEVPAALTLIAAHRDLEDLCLERSLAAFKRAQVEPLYAELAYNGLWFGPLRAGLAAFIEESQKPVTGEVRMQLHKGGAIIEGRRSPKSLYTKHLATYDQGDTFDHTAAAGFVALWGLPLKVWSDVQGDL